MKRYSRMMYCLLPALVAGVGCNKSSGATAAGTEVPAAGRAIVAPAPAVAASTSPAVLRVGTAAAAAAPDPSAAASMGNPVVTSTAASAPAADAASPETIRKQAQIEWALKQDEIKNDPNGQWATQAKASSTNYDAQGASPYAASQATGLPNVESPGNNASAWTPKTPDAGIEWLELQYSKPVHATQVRVRETYGAGAVMKVELFDQEGLAHTVWTGADSTKDLDYLVVTFPKTAFKTGRVKLTLATNVVHGWNEIDAVQLVGTEQ
jgi:hypothetical protein